MHRIENLQKVKIRFSTIITVILIAMLIATNVHISIVKAATKTKIEKPVVNANEITVIDCRSGAIIYNKGGDTRLNPLDMTQVMMAVTITQKGKVTDEQKMALKVAIKSSNAESIQTIATAVFGSVETTCQKANELAKELGCKNTNFTSITGISADANHYSTTNDIAKFVKIFYKDTALYDTLESSDKGNAKVTMQRGSAIENINTLVMASKNDTQIVAISYGCVSQDSNVEDSKKMLQYLLTEYRTHKVLSKDEYVKRTKVRGGSKSYVKAYPKEDLYVTLPKEGDDDIVKTKVSFNDDIIAPLKENTVVGKVQALEVGTVTAEVELVVKESVAKGGPWSKIGISDRMLIIIVALAIIIVITVLIIKMRKRKKRRRQEYLNMLRKQEEERRLAAEKEEKRRRDWPW